MDDPESYHKAEIFKSDMENFLNEYKSKIHLRADGRDSLLDIGCAGGNITVDVIRPILLPITFSRLMGVDINRAMVNYANENFKLPNVSFDVLDIGGDISDFSTVHQCFDHVTSTLCLHLVPDQQRALNNIFQLLQPSGDCLLYIVVDCVAFDNYFSMQRKWSKYMVDADDFISPYYRRVNPEYLLERYLKNAGFKRCEIKMRKQAINFDSIEKLREGYQSVIPFLHRMSAMEKEEFIDEFMDLTLKESLEQNGSKKDDFHNGAGAKISIPYTLMTAFAEKN